MVACSLLLPKECIIYLIYFTSSLPEMLLIWKLIHRRIFININSWFEIITMIVMGEVKKTTLMQKETNSLIHTII